MSGLRFIRREFRDMHVTGSSPPSTITARRIAPHATLDYFHDNSIFFMSFSIYFTHPFYHQPRIHRARFCKIKRISRCCCIKYLDSGK